MSMHAVARIVLFHILNGGARGQEFASAILEITPRFTPRGMRVF